jgi:hypothetical protein
MVLRNLRWMTAGLVALVVVVLAPARSNAEVTILVEELDSGGGVLATQTTSLGGSGSTNFTGIYFSGLVTLSTNSGLSSPTASLTPSFSGILTSDFDVTQDHKLRITVTDTNFVPNGGPNGTLKVETQGTTGFASGSLSIVEDTRLYDPNTNATIALISGLVSPNGDRVTASTGVSGLTNPFAIQQTITVSFQGDIPTNATFGASGGSSMTSQPVPAPGGLVLALIGLPLLGIRRALRKSGTA